MISVPTPSPATDVQCIRISRVLRSYQNTRKGAPGPRVEAEALHDASLSTKLLRPAVPGAFHIGSNHSRHSKHSGYPTCQEPLYGDALQARVHRHDLATSLTASVFKQRTLPQYQVEALGGDQPAVGSSAAHTKSTAIAGGPLTESRRNPTTTHCISQCRARKASKMTLARTVRPAWV